MYFLMNKDLEAFVHLHTLRTLYFPVDLSSRFTQGNNFKQQGIRSQTCKLFLKFPSPLLSVPNEGKFI